MRSVILLVLLLFAQTPVALGNRDVRTRRDRVPYKRLSWSDFRVDDTSPGLSAQTQTYLSYRYTARAERAPLATTFSASVASITFTGGFDRARSWRRSSVAESNSVLLEHEQGHLDINELKLRQLKNLHVTELPMGRGKTAKAALDDLDSRLKKSYQWHLDDLEKTQIRYDRETNYGTRLDPQRDWSARLQRAISATDE